MGPGTTHAPNMPDQFGAVVGGVVYRYVGACVRVCTWPQALMPVLFAMLFA
jgi:hypothetical protein